MAEVIAVSAGVVAAASVILGITEACASRSHHEFMMNGKKRIRWEYNENRDDERQKVSECPCSYIILLLGIFLYVVFLLMDVNIYS
jgi:hypothetical protein